jgi:hypothetical protein
MVDDTTSKRPEGFAGLGVHHVRDRPFGRSSYARDVNLRRRADVVDGVTAFAPVSRIIRPSISLNPSR